MGHLLPALQYYFLMYWLIRQLKSNQIQEKLQVTMRPEIHKDTIYSNECYAMVITASRRKQIVSDPRSIASSFFLIEDNNLNVGWRTLWDRKRVRMRRRKKPMSIYIIIWIIWMTCLSHIIIIMRLKLFHFLIDNKLSCQLVVKRKFELILSSNVQVTTIL